MAQKKVYTVIKEHRGRETEYTGTVEELVGVFDYTLMAGHSWEGHKGCVRVTRYPKTIQSLLTALRNAVINTQGNCFNPDHYYLKEV